MPKYSFVKKVLVIGSGPIVIGQAAEFDYAGTQACRALKEEGLEVVLINSNPATIMTDSNIADHVYIEPLTTDTVKRIILKEKPDSVLPALGGQTGLNLAMELAEEGFFEEHNVKLLGTNVDSIKKAEDRQAFKDTMESIGQPCIASKVVETIEDALDFADEIGYPVIVRPAYTLGGTGGGIAYDKDELFEIGRNGLRLSRVTQILIEKCISGWKEIEFEVMRDSKDNAITICSMENIDPVGVHTGDSVVVAPALTLTNKEYQMLRNAALKIISALKIEGGCNCQFALNPNSFEYAVIEVNPRVSRSSALASKATGYPIAKVTSKIAIGYGLDEIVNAVTKSTYACFEPTIDYVVIKFPRFPFDKFVKASKKLGTQMKATGEIMSISNNFEAAVLKAVRSLEIGTEHAWLKSQKDLSDAEIIDKIFTQDYERMFSIFEGLRRNIITIEEIAEKTMIDIFFLKKFKNIIDMEVEIANNFCEEVYLKAKKMGFLDSVIEKLAGQSFTYHKDAVYKIVDTCAAEFKAQTPYYYSTFDEENESVRTDKKKILVLGSGPIRIGQGIEFDYCSVHCVWALREEGYETIIANNNPETVSTDFDTSDKLYFEPLTREDMSYLIKTEKPDGAIVQFGGQTAIKLTKDISELGVKILGTQPDDIDAAEDRERFDELLERLQIKRPKGRTVFTTEEAIKVANELEYPVLVRPSYVLGGQGMEIAYSDADVIEFMDIISGQIELKEHPILIDKYMLGKEIEVDAICDGKDILIPGIMEHLERAGVHSGDSISVYPARSISGRIKDTIIDYTEKLAKGLNVIGLVNIQFIVYQDEVYVIEVNPRSSRTVPYISKVTTVPMVDLATKVILGTPLKDLGYGTGLYKESEYVCVKVPVFSFEKLHGVDTTLGPEMKSTGEVLGVAKTFEEALYKGILAAGIKIKDSGKAFISVRDTDKQEVIEIAEMYAELGYDIYATGRTANVLNQNFVAASSVRRMNEESPNVYDMLSRNEFDVIINTPRKGREPQTDGFRIRRMAVEHSIPCFTSLDTARAVAKCMMEERDNKEFEVIDTTKL
ncbi:MAG: carbamoyl-phosphate synthase large subunit [Clostridia bacterium]|nr:carbamoyl-phosphate synthase large subunit [Clostridia bacterium]